MDKFDGLHVWLGIPPVEQPPNHYRLLGIPLFEANLDVIENAAESRMLKLKSVQTGPHSALSQQLLNMVAAAQVCLLSATKKAAYDAQLAEEMSRSVEPVTANATQAYAPPVVVSESGRAFVRITNKRVKTSAHPLLGSAKLVLGGAAGIFVAVLIVFYFTGRDILGVRPPTNGTGVVDGGPASDRPGPASDRQGLGQLGESPHSSDSIRPSNTVSDSGMLHGMKSTEVKPESNSAITRGAAPANEFSDREPAPTPESSQLVVQPAEPRDPRKIAAVPDAEDAASAAPVASSPPISDSVATQPPPALQPDLASTNALPPVPALSSLIERAPAAERPPSSNLDAPNRKKIEDAIVKFKASSEKFKQRVRGVFDTFDATARRQGNSEKIGIIAESRLQFENLGILPTGSTAALQQEQRKIAAALEIAYQSAAKECLKENKDELAAALEVEFNTVLRSVWRELLVNPSCEEAVANGKIPGWETVRGGWTAGSGWPPVHGRSYFSPGTSPDAELIQDVDVRHLTPELKGGTQSFTVRAYLRTYNQSPPDTCRIILEYLDSSKQRVLHQYDSGQEAPVADWKLIANTSLAPPEASWIRIHLISHRNGRGTKNNDARYDLISLTPLDAESLSNGS